LIEKTNAAEYYERTKYVLVLVIFETSDPDNIFD
jgi:hypothetical protein